MSTNRKPLGSIHKIREFELEKIHLADEFDILQIVGEGWFGKILLVEHRATDTEMVLKALPKPYVSLRDFYREFHYGLHLGVHKNIVTTYDVAFETAGFYVFTQEYALLGDLTSNVTESGIGELHSKRVAKQIASALDYMHSKSIVHRDVKLDNVLIYKSDFSRVKLCDFGESYRVGTTVERRNEWLPYSPPEVLQIQTEGTYKADTSHDVWQFGILIFVCLTGCLPWQKAAPDDPRYVTYLAWHATNMVLPFRRTPKLFKLFSSKGSRMFRKFLEPKVERRPRNLSELSNFMDDRWLTKGAEKNLAVSEQDELCASMYSFHSSPEEKNKLLSTLAEYGIETTVDRVAKKNRIKDWIESSVITEEDEEEDSGSNTSAPTTIAREPVAGHISSIRAEEAKKQINTTLKDASQKHFDPRTGEIQTGPSEMGVVLRARAYSGGDISNIPNGKMGSFDNGSVVTLASRNDLILSEVQAYHSNNNMSLLGDDDMTAEPMVNASDHQKQKEFKTLQQIKQQQINQPNNIAAISNHFLYDDATSSSRFNTTANTTANNSLYYNSSSNNNSQSYDQINKRYSASALQVNQIDNGSNYGSYANFNNHNNNSSNTCSNFAYYNSFNSFEIAGVVDTRRPSSPQIQSIVNLSSVPANDRQRISAVSIENNGYHPHHGSYEKIMRNSFDDHRDDMMKSESPASDIGAGNETSRNSKKSPPNGLDMNGRHNNRQAGESLTNRYQNNNNNNNGGQATMKDTPYDHIKVKKVDKRI